jgi:hypothetical protein
LFDHGILYVFDFQGVILFQNRTKETGGFKALNSYFHALKLPERWHLSPRNPQDWLECKIISILFMSGGVMVTAVTV